jgi:hypothetical protein
MNDYILLMHNDAPGGTGDSDDAWTAYFAKLRQSGAFQGGSAIGGGACASRSSPARAITQHLSGYIRVQAESLDSARELLIGNPVFESGGTVEIRELPKT